MQSGALIFYLLFATVLFLTYMAIRREWARPGPVAALGVMGGIVTMTLTALAQGNGIVQAFVVGILIGSIFSGATLAVAWYFHSNELRARYIEEHGHPIEPGGNYVNEGEEYYR